MQALVVTLTHNLFQQIIVPLTFRLSIIGIDRIYISENVSSIYTSGRKCNFKGKGCDAEHLQPINVNGWFWAGAGNARIPRTDQPAENSFWSRNGERVHIQR